MGQRMTYIYKVEMGAHGAPAETRYCYARNAGVAVEEFKKICKDLKYDYFKATPFGDVDIKHHPGPFELMPEDEVAYIKQRKYGEAQLYSNRKDRRGPQIPEDAVFVPVEGKS